MSTPIQPDASPEIRLIACRPEFLLEIVKLWRESLARALDLTWSQNWPEVERHLRGHYEGLPLNRVTVAMDTGSSTIAGFMERRGSEIDNLYVHVNYQRCGLGRRFVQLAKDSSPELLELYTFQRNTGAQRFYLNQGFREVARGTADVAHNPWAQSANDLADIRYRWTPTGG